MKRTDNDIEALIRNIRIQASPQMHRDTLGDALTAYEESQATLTAEKPVQKGTWIIKPSNG